MLAVYFYRKRRQETKDSHIKQEALDAGLTEPASLHPVINPHLCIGCQACVKACPENTVLGLIGNKAELINPTFCIGHGACKDACPTQAIQLVFGTATRGVDIPVVSPTFETNVPGIFIAGELGGMGLIRNAVTQGKQAIENVRRLDGIGRKDRLDVVIVGAGPTGIAASLAAKMHGLSYATLEQDTLGGTIAHYPRGKIVMTAPMELPLFGKVKLKETSKEALIELWQVIQEKTGIQISCGERVTAVSREGDSLVVETPTKRLPTRAVLLAIGRRGTPRTLDVPGETLSKVVYRLIDPEQYLGQRVLVVGGGDSALEAAASLADQRTTAVTLAYRRGVFDRAQAQNRRKVADAADADRLDILMNAEVRTIHDDLVDIELGGEPVRLRNDSVIVCAGGNTPNAFLASMGIHVETKYGTA